MALNYVDLSFPSTACASAAIKTMVGVLASTHVALRWLESAVSVNSGTSTDVPATVVLQSCTFATNAPGTSSTAITSPAGKRDLQRDTYQFTAAYGWSAQPTVLTVIRTIFDPQYNGLYHYINPLSSPYIIAGGGGGAISVTPGTGTPSVSGHMTVEE